MIRIATGKFNRSDILFFTAYILYTFANVLDLTIWAASAPGVSTLLKLLRYGAYAICVAKIFLEERYKEKKIWVLLMAVASVVISWQFSERVAYLYYLLFFIAAYGISIDRIIRCTMWIQSLVLAVNVTGSLINLSEDYIWESEGRIRHFLGFDWITFSPILYFFVMLEYIFLKKGKISWKEYIVFNLINYLLFDLTNTRMTFLITFLLLTFFFVFSGRFAEKIFIKCFGKIFILMPFLFTGVAVWASYAYNPANETWLAVNELLSNRLKLSQSALKNYGITLFGQPIEWVGHTVDELLSGATATYNYVDCSYLQILFTYGIIPLIMILTAYACIIKWGIDSKEYYICWIILFVLILSITEPRLISLSFNPFIFIFFTEAGRLPYDNRKELS